MSTWIQLLIMFCMRCKDSTVFVASMLLSSISSSSFWPWLLSLLLHNVVLPYLLPFTNFVKVLWMNSIWHLNVYVFPEAWVWVLLMFCSWYYSWGEKLASIFPNYPSWYCKRNSNSSTTIAVCCIYNIFGYVKLRLFCAGVCSLFIYYISL